jgi:predicted nucleic acid-binding protein
MSADVTYLDTSAMVKLLMQEPESPALRSWLGGWPRRSSSALLRVELVRTARRAGLPRLVAEARRQVAGVHLIRLDDDLLERAADLEPASLRSLDAVHLAAAMSLGSDLGAVVSYDERMLDGAHALGLPVSTPR